MHVLKPPFMIAIGPWVPHPFTPLGSRYGNGLPQRAEQVPNTCQAALKLVALPRLQCPEANIPATTALAALDPEDYLAALKGGANVIMLDVTPEAYRIPYDIYPSQIRIRDAAKWNQSALRALRASGRPIGKDLGGRRRRNRPTAGTERAFRSDEDQDNA